MIDPLASPSGKSRRIVLAALAALGSLIVLLHPPAALAGSGRTADRSAYVLLAQGSSSSTMSGSMEDLDRARALRVGREALLYVREGDAAYIIRDASTLRRAEAIFEPQQALGARQAELGSRQAELGSRQAALGAQQARIGVRQAGASPSQQGALGRRQEALGRRQEELGRQQDALGRQQDALGRQQDRLAREADAKFRALLAEALERGVARRIN